MFIDRKSPRLKRMCSMNDTIVQSDRADRYGRQTPMHRANRGGNNRRRDVTGTETTYACAVMLYAAIQQ
ncbi:MAG: hypothetical protein GY878_24740 [Fuerstiella sp.]|nr:hypothetical protein [Fuerstiella sp.]